MSVLCACNIHLTSHYFDNAGHESKIFCNATYFLITQKPASLSVIKSLKSPNNAVEKTKTTANQIQYNIGSII